MNDYERGWVVGFLEGEASFTTYQDKRGVRRLRIQVAQVQREPLDRLQGYSGLGKIAGPYKNSPLAHHSLIFKWREEGAIAATFLRLVASSFSPRRQTQIGNALASWESRRQRVNASTPRKGRTTILALRAKAS